MNCFFSMFAALALVHQGKADSTEGIICDPDMPPTDPAPLDPSGVGAFINEVSLGGTGCSLGYYVEVATNIKATLVVEVYNAVLDCTATTTSTTSTTVTTSDGGVTTGDSTGIVDFEDDCTGNPKRLFQFTHIPADDIVDGSIYVFNYTNMVVQDKPEAITYRLYAVDGQYSCQVTHLFTVGTNDPSEIDGIKPTIIVDDTAVGDKWIYGATGTGWYLGDFNYTKFDDEAECTLGMANAGQTFDVSTGTTTTTQGLPSSGFSVMGNNLMIIMGLMTLVGMA